MNQRVTLGRLGAAFGVKGWLKVNSYTEDALGILEYSPWQVKVGNEWRQYDVETGRPHAKGIIVKLVGVDDRTAAELLRGSDIAVDEDQLPALADDEYYWRDLIGMQVVTDSGYDLGQVSSLLETGSNDVLVVKANARDAFGKTERLLPFIMDQVIQTIDAAEKQIVVNWDPSF